MTNNITAPHNWLFTFNTLDNLWYATTRDNYFDLFNERLSASLVTNQSLEDLILNVTEMVQRTEGTLGLFEKNK